MDSISYRVHTPRNAAREYLYHGELVTALLMNSQANLNRIKNDVDFMAYSVPIMANQLAMLPTDYMLKQFHWLDSDKKVDYIRGRFHLPSSHYDIGYRVDIDREFIDISFSIPKYIYGHSVAQFIRNPHLAQTKDNGWFDSFESITQHWFKMLHEVTNDFFRKTFTGIEINLELVEIIRIDLAFNQYFKSKEEATRVADLMSKKRVSGIRGKRGRKEFRHDEHSSGFVAIGRNFYYKVYHKGTEFRTVGDMKRLIKHNQNVDSERSYFKKKMRVLHGVDESRNDPNKGYEESQRFLNKYGRGYYDVNAIAAEADLILRHEIRFVPKSMSYIFKNKVFRSSCPIWKKKKERYKELHALEQRILRGSKEIMEKTERKELEALKKIVQKRHRFMLKVPNNVKRWQHSDNGVHENFHTGVLFSQELFSQLVKKFHSIIEDIQVQEFPTWDTIKQKITEENIWRKNWNKFEHAEDRKPIINQSTVKKAIEYINNYGSLEAALEMDLISKATFYRLRNLLSELGLNSVMDRMPISVDTSFQSYFERLKGTNTTDGRPKYLVYFANTPENYKRIF